MGHVMAGRLQVTTKTTLALTQSTKACAHHRPKGDQGHIVGCLHKLHQAPSIRLIKHRRNHFQYMHECLIIHIVSQNLSYSFENDILAHFG